jgi:putative oxidoreductase
MRCLFQNRWFVLLLRLALGGLFAYAGWMKLADPQQFADSIHAFQVFPTATINIIALCLPPFEILLGGMLIVGWKSRAAALGAFFLSIVFAVAIGQAALRGIPVDCGCFGSGVPSTRATYVSLVRALGILIGSLFLYRRIGTVPSEHANERNETGK